MAAATDGLVEIRRALLEAQAALQARGHSPAAVLAVSHAQSLALVSELFGTDAAMHLCQRAAERIAAISQEFR
jgi:hypothetical protein